MTLRKRLISLCMVMVLVFSLSAVCASAAQEAVAEQPTVSMSFDLDNRVKHEKTVRLPDGSIAKITAEPINTGRALSGVWKITGTNGWDNNGNIGLNWKKLAFTQKLSGHGGLR